MTITGDDFRISDEDAATIAKIVHRTILAARATEEPGTLRVDPASLTMDLTIYHKRKGLKLCALLAAASADFFHDVVRIIRHMDRRTGECPYHARHAAFAEAEAEREAA